MERGPIRIGEHIYTLGKRIGEGSYGSVYRGRREGDDTRYAIKVSTLVSRDRSISSAVMVESSVIGSLDHPNIVKLVDASVVGDYMYLVMPLGKRDFHSVRLPPLQARTIIHQLLSATLHMENSGVVHRDIKPANIIEVRGRAVLIDFSLSTFVHRPTNKDVVTLSWRHPSLFLSGEDFPYDTRVDVWSIAVTMYNLLTGEPLFQGATEMKMLEGIVSSHPEGPSWYYRNEDDLIDMEYEGSITAVEERMRGKGIGEEEISFMMFMMRMDLDDVPFPKECLSHPYFLGKRYVDRPIVSLPSSRVTVTPLHSAKRSMLFNWMKDVCDNGELRRQVYPNAIAIFDRYWERLVGGEVYNVPDTVSVVNGQVPHNHVLQPLGAASLLIAIALFDEDEGTMDTITDNYAIVPYVSHVYNSIGCMGRSCI